MHGETDEEIEDSKPEEDEFNTTTTHESPDSSHSKWSLLQLVGVDYSSDESTLAK